MNHRIKTLVAAGAVAFAAQAAAQVTFFEREGFAGRQFTADRSVGNFDRFGFNDSASSVIVRSGWWELCENDRFSGNCVTLRPGSYGSLASMGLNNRVSSVRPAQPQYSGKDRGVYSPTGYDYRRRKDERIFQADVTSVRAVVGPPEQRCWVERQAVSTGGSNYSIPGGIAGAVIGGILGHQIGGGRGQDIATGVGAVGGAVVGANAGRNYGNQQVVTQDVQRCETVSSNSRPDYWDVTYNFRGSEHRVQLTSPPGPTILVNGKGEPRV